MRLPSHGADVSAHRPVLPSRLVRWPGRSPPLLRSPPRYTRPTTTTPLQDATPLVVPEVLPDLPEPEGISDWLPSVSLESLFDEPEAPPPPQQNFTVIEKKQSVSEWAAPEAQAPTVPDGWTRPGQ